ncbi:MAG: hypothetical protein AABY03_02635 [Nanoarchaeota archaeon]
MNLQFYLEKLSSSDELKKFKKENPKAYLCSAFFIIDKEGKNNKVHFDYFVPKGNIISFHTEKEIKKEEMENFSSVLQEKIQSKFDLDFNDVESLISKRMEEENIKNKIQKIILSLQNYKGEEILSGTVFISAMGMIKISIDLKKMEIVDFEKKSIMDILNIVKKK